MMNMKQKSPNRESHHATGRCLSRCKGIRSEKAQRFLEKASPGRRSCRTGAKRNSAGSSGESEESECRLQQGTKEKK
jgi:hypothetical protein